jgi:hypothetical protein
MLPSSGVSADGGGMHSPPILAPHPVSDALHRVQWARTIAGYIVDAVEPIAMLALIGLALGYRSRSSRKGFLVFAGIVGALAHLSIWTSVSRLGSIALFAVIAVRIVRGGPLRILALVTLATVLASLFGSELLDTIGVPGIWFPFNIGVSRTQYVYAIGIPLLATLIVRTLLPRNGQR